MRTRWDDDTETRRPLVTRGDLPDETVKRIDGAKPSTAPLFIIAAVLVGLYLIMKAVDSGMIIVMR